MQASGTAKGGMRPNTNKGEKPRQKGKGSKLESEPKGGKTKKGAPLKMTRKNVHSRASHGATNQALKMGMSKADAKEGKGWGQVVNTASQQRGSKHFPSTPFTRSIVGGQ